MWYEPTKILGSMKIMEKDSHYIVLRPNLVVDCFKYIYIYIYYPHVISLFLDSRESLATHTVHLLNNNGRRCLLFPIRNIFTFNLYTKSYIQTTKIIKFQFLTLIFYSQIRVSFIRTLPYFYFFLKILTF